MECRFFSVYEQHGRCVLDLDAVILGAAELGFVAAAIVNGHLLQLISGKEISRRTFDKCRPLAALGCRRIFFVFGFLHGLCRLLLEGILFLFLLLQHFVHF